MNTNLIISKIASKNKGQFFKIGYITDVPMSAKGKKEGHIVLKYTRATVRWGINFSNIKAVQERRAESVVEKTEHDLPWGTWSATHPGLVIEHKGIEYIRLYTTPNKNRSTFYLDGRPIDVEVLKKTGYIIPSYWNKKPMECLTIKAGNIQDIF